MGRSISSLPSVLKQHRWPALATFAAVMGTAIAYLAFTPRLYETSARLMLDEKQVSVSDLGRDITKLPSNTPGGPSPIATQAELVKSERVLQRALAQVAPQSQQSSSQKALKTGDLSKNLKVKIVPATNILELSYRGRDPVLSAKLLNAIAEAMRQESAEANRSEAHSVREFLEAEVPKQRQRLEQAEAAETKYRQTSGVIDLTQQTESLVESIANAEEQERTTLAQLRDSQSRDISLQQVTNAGTPKNAYTAVRVGQDEELKNLRTKLAELDTQLVDARARFTDTHPVVQALLDQRKATSALYNQKLSRISPQNQAIPPSNIATDPLSQDLTSKSIVQTMDRTALEQKLKAIQVEKAQLQARLAQLPIKQQPLTILTRRREEAANSLKLLQQKLEEARIAEAQQVSNIRIIGLAQPPESPQWPRRSVVLVVAIAFGTILSIGVVLLLEVMDNTLRDASEAEELLNIPLLQELPKMPVAAIGLDRPERFLDDISLVEPYRMLLKTLEFRSSKKLRLIVVSSALSGEGKSVVVSHLAAVSAMLYRRTLVIDADLRRPTQHDLLNLPAQPGVTDVVKGKISLAQAAQPTHLENLSVLTYGELLNRPSQLLESAAMKHLLAEAATQYDLVIIDTPALGSCADAATLSKYSDGVVLVTRPSYTPRDTLTHAVSELTRNGLPVLGVVVNGTTNPPDKYYRYSADSFPAKSKLVKHLTDLRTATYNSNNGLRSMNDAD